MVLVQRAAGTWPVRIGLITTLSGPAAAQGRRFLLGAEMAIQHANHEGKEIARLVTLDDSGESSLAREALVQLVKEHQVQGVLLPFGCPDDGQAAELGVVAVSPLPERHSSSATTFHLWPATEMTAGFLAGKAVSLLKSSRIGLLRSEIMAPESPYEAALREAVRAHGSSISGVETFPIGGQGCRDRVRRLLESTPDLILITQADPQEAVHLVVEIRKAHPRIPILADDWCAGESLFEAGSLLEGSYFASLALTPDADTHLAVAGFDAAFRSLHGESAGALARTGYSAVMILVQAAGHGETSPEEIARNLRERAWITPFGRVTFDGAGSNVGVEYALFRVSKEKKPVLAGE